MSDRRAIVRGGGATYELRPGEALRIGRHADNDVVLADGAVSRFHVTLRWEPGGGPMLYDNGSQNGTLVGGQEVRGRAVPLAPFEVGPFAFDVELVRGARAVEDSSDAVALFTEQGPVLEGKFDPRRSLRELLLCFEVEVRTGTLEVRTAAGKARLVLANGKLRSVTFDRFEGVAALEVLIVATRGTWRFTRDVQPIDATLDLRFSDFLRALPRQAEPPTRHAPRKPDARR